MRKKTFHNLPSEDTPVEAGELNEMQTWIDEDKIDKTLLAYTGDLNDLTTGFVWANPSALNIPTSGYNFIVTTIKYSNSYIEQTAQQFASTSQARVTYKRQCFGGTWGDWEVLGAEQKYTDLTSYLQNSWVTNGQVVACVLPNGTKILTVSVKDGTDSRIMNLPAVLRPSGIVYGIAGNTGSVAGSLTITSAGAVTVGSSLVSSGNACFSIMYQ